MARSIEVHSSMLTVLQNMYPTKKKSVSIESRNRSVSPPPFLVLLTSRALTLVAGKSEGINAMPTLRPAVGEMPTSSTEYVHILCFNIFVIIWIVKGGD